ncbi:retrotransposon protein, putative, ty1-copia subclass [Tanacetum coccineum]
MRSNTLSTLGEGIAPVTIIDRQLPFEYTITSRSTDVVVMTHPVQNINHSAFRSMFEREKLSGNNFNDWFRQLKLVLRVEKKMFVIEQPLPAAPAANSEAQVLLEWNAVYDAYNEVACLILGSMTAELHRQFENSSPYDMIKELKAMFEKQARVERFDLIQTFHAYKQEEGKPVAAYVIQMKGYVDQLECLGYVLPHDLIVVGELHAMLIEYGNGLPKKAETPQVMMIKGGKISKAKKKSIKAKGKEHPSKDETCHHCKEVGHWKRKCPVYLAELLKKKKKVDTASSSGIFTIELFVFPNKSWVYDTSCGTHICITKQGFKEARKLKQGALYLYVGNDVHAQVEAIGSFDLVLPNGLVICLDNCHYAHSILRGVVLVHRLVENRFVQRFTDFEISISKNNVHYFNAIPSNGIYEIDMHNLVPNVNFIYIVSTKRAKHNLDSIYLWHCRLAHISKKRIEKLQHEGLLKSTDDESFDQCVSCLSGKMTRKSFPHHPERATDLLRIIHTDVCGSLRHVLRQVFKNKVENQLEKTIKALRSDRGSEYISQEFKDYLKACAIVQQLTPPYTPQHNGVSERINRTLLDMVRSIMNLTTLPLSFLDYALESATHILNMVPTKKVDKTPYELWYGKVLNLSYLKVWGCEALVKRDMPDKLQQRSVKCIFIGYPKETMGYYFYFPTENKIVVTRYAEFFEKNLITQEVSGRSIDLEEIQDEDTSPSEITSEIPMDVESFEPPQDEEILIRRSERTRRALNRLSLNVEVEEHSLGDLNEPTSYKAAMLYSESNKFGFAQNLDEPCVYQKASGSNVTFLNLYVDDIIIMGNHIPSLQSVKDYLGKCFAMKDLGEAAFILGIKIYRDRSKRLIGLGQNAYMDKILKRYRMDKSKRGYIPMQERLDLNKTQGASTPEEVKRMQNVPYALVVGSIMCAYLRNTKDMFLVYGGNLEAELQVNCYCNAGFETDIDDMKSLTGYSIALGEIRFLKVHTDDNLADPFTKALSKGKLTQHARSMGLRLASSFM